MWPKPAAPARVLAPSRSKSHRVPGSLAPGFSPARMPRRWLGCFPVSFSNKNRGSPGRRRLPVPVQPPLHAANCSGQAALLRGPRGSPTQRRLVPLRSRVGGRAAGLRTRAGQGGRPGPTSAPPTLILHSEATRTPHPGLKMRLPSAGHNPHPRKRTPEPRAQRSLQAHRAELSKLLACSRG